jgi:hypothetical protein
MIMRMWMVRPQTMCNKHLLGEHVECHMFAGTIRKGIRLDGYIRNNCFEGISLRRRHRTLAKEMEGRGMAHKSEMPGDLNYINLPGKIDRKANEENLYGRCPECKRRHLLLEEGANA